MLEKKVLQFINNHELIQDHSRILVGVSGGPDSLALLHFLHQLRDEKSLYIVAAHVDHMFRGKQSYDELLFVQNICKQWNIEFVGKQINVQEKMNQYGTGLQETARKERYHFFSHVMKAKKLELLALGHHGDDQIETILMRLTRGSDWQGRAGIPVKRKFDIGYVIRPFLCVTREEINRYCSKYLLNPVQDPSNEKLDYSRNRFRIKVLPFLKEENHNVHLHFQRYSEEQHQDHQYLMELTVQQMNKLMKRKTKQYYEITISPFLTLPIPLQRRGIHLILNYLYKELPHSLSAIHIDAILRLISNKRTPSGILNLPKGLIVQRAYDICSFHFPSEKSFSYNYMWDLSQNIELPNGNIICTDEIEKSMRGNDVFLLDTYKISTPLYIRTRMNGDRMRLKGTNGSKKIKDIFIDEKIPVFYRDDWPIVTSNDGEIIWIPGLKKSCHEAEWDEKNLTHFVLLKYQRNDVSKF